MIATNNTLSIVKPSIQASTITPFTVNTGNNKVLFVYVFEPNTNSVTYNGIALTQINSNNPLAIAPYGNSGWYQLINPPVGTFDIVTTQLQQNGTEYYLNVLAVNNVNQSQPIANSSQITPNGGCSGATAQVPGVSVLTTQEIALYNSIKYDINNNHGWDNNSMSACAGGASVAGTYNTATVLSTQSNNSAIELSAVSSFNSIGAQKYGFYNVPTNINATTYEQFTTLPLLGLPVTTTQATISGIACPIAYPVVYAGTTYTTQASLITALETQYTGFTVAYNNTACSFDFTGTGTAPTTVTLSLPVYTVAVTGVPCPITYPIIYNGVTYTTQASFVSAVQAVNSASTVSYNASGCTFTVTGGNTPAPINITAVPVPTNPILNTTCIPATSVTQTTATINASINPNNQTGTFYYLSYGVTTAYGSVTTTTTLPFSDNTAHNITIPLAGLLPNTTYNYRLSAGNDSGINANGLNCTFTTPAVVLLPPVLNTTCVPATNISNSNATLNSTINTQGFATTYVFKYGVATGVYTTTTPVQTTTTGGNVTANIIGLLANTTYFYKLEATSSQGVVSSLECSFKTVPFVEITCSTPSTIQEVDPVLNIIEKWCGRPNILTQDNLFAHSLANQNSAIEVGNFAFNIGADDIVSGFTVYIKARKNTTNNPTITVYLVDNAGVKTYYTVGTITTLTNTNYQEFTFGGNFSLFGITATNTLVNNIGLALVANDEVEVESVRVCVARRCPDETVAVESKGCVGWAQIQTKKTIRVVNINDNEILLSEFNTIPDNTNNTRALIMSDFQGKYFYGTLNEGTSQEEVVKITSIQPQLNGNVKLILGARGIKLTRPTISGTTVLTDPANKKTHHSGSSFVISNPAVYYDDYARCYACSTNCDWTIANADLTNRGMVEIATPCEVLSGAIVSDSGAPLVVSTQNNFAKSYLGSYIAVGGLHTTVANPLIANCPLTDGQSFDVLFTDAVLTGQKWNYNGVDYTLCDVTGTGIVTGQIPSGQQVRLVYQNGCMMVENVKPVISAPIAGHTIASINGTNINETITTLNLTGGSLNYINEAGVNNSIALLSTNAGQIATIGTDGKILVQAPDCYKSYAGQYSDTNTQAVVWVNGGSGVGNMTIGTASIPTPPVAAAGYKWVMDVKAYAGMSATNPINRARLAAHIDVTAGTNSYTIFDDFDDYVDNFPISTGSPVYSRRKSAHAVARDMNQTGVTTATIKLFITTSFVPDPNTWATNQNILPFDDGAPAWYLEYRAYQILK